ncbi:MAG: hypothetical protein LBJ10_05865 [Clostridiales bacterium]|jgi:hypothetical protein|nr:hypothetical protein [Clostridiales bacterium]
MAWAKLTLDTLVDSWGRECEACANPNAGGYDAAGMYAPPAEEWEPAFGIIAYATQEAIIPADTGAHTLQDLYFVTRASYQDGALVRDGGRVYAILERADISAMDQTGLFSYRLKIGGRMDSPGAWEGGGGNG